MTDLVQVTRDVEQPPGGWYFTIEQTGLKITGPSAFTLQRRVKAHMVANSLPIPEDFPAWFEDAMCRQMDLGRPFCGQTPKNPPPSGVKHLSLALVERFIKTVALTIKGRKLVPQEEAERRAAICVACPMNTTIGGCRSCYAIARPLKALLGNRTTEAKPAYCRACGCDLSAKCWIPNDVLNKAEFGHNLDYAPGCWRLEAAPAEDLEG